MVTRWMADLGSPLCLTPPVIGQVVVVRQTAKTAELEKRTPASGYRARVRADELYPTREACIAGIRERCLKEAETLRKRAADFEAAVGD